MDFPSATDSLGTPHRQSGQYEARGRHLPRVSGEEPGPLDQPDRFAAYVAHELRTPIALQLLLAEAALADPRPDGAALRALGEGVVASCEQQQRLIEALLDLTHCRCGLRSREPIDLAAIMSEVLGDHDLGDLESAVTLEPAVALGDPTLVERLAANLVSNAVRHNTPHGRIEVATRSDAGGPMLSVANTGPRIPTGELTRLFQPFERAGRRPQARADGIGLGLAIVQSIAEAHGASVAAWAPMGGGLQIEVRFPAGVSTSGK